jgi:phage tail sheath gpL-like
MSGSQVLLPSVTLILQNADGEVENTPQRVLLIGQKLAGGSAVSGSLVQNIESSGAPENALFGQSSQLAAMVRAFKRLNPIVRLDAIPVSDAGGGVARVVTFTVVGPATAAGSITVVAGSELLHKFEVAFASGDTATVIAGNIVAAVNADLDCPFTASNIAGAVSLTADNLGTVANTLGVEVSDITVGAGVSVAAVTQSVAGATDPTLTTVFDNATERYQGVVWPYSVVTVLASFLSPRFNPTNAVMDGVGFVTRQDTFANLLSGLNALNDHNLVIFVDEQTTETLYLGPAQNEASYAKSAMFAALRSLRLTEDANISRFLTSSASLDQFGGPALASLPYFNSPLEDLPLIKAGRGWTQVEIGSLVAAGGSIMGVNFTGTGALVGEVVTTYKTDPAANPDATFKYLNYVDTSSQAREYFHNNLKNRFAQSRLTEGAVTRGRDMANATVIRAYLEKLYLDLAGAEFVLVQDGETAIRFFKGNVDVTLDLEDGQVTVSMLVPIVTQLRLIVATMKIAFSVES